ncbi:MAG: sensor histidine kinase [Dehalococcoidia bacterium]|nr:sensor histidine kinase [Dehalococcoidia bacterium]
MKAEAGASWPDAAPAASARRLLDLRGAVRRLSERFRDWRFWAVQALVLIITALHWELEATEALGEHEALSFVPVSFYFIPIVYAGLNFGMEGALPTALWSATLAMPNMFVWHAGLQRLGELLQLTIMVSVAIVVARRVDLETKQRLRAESTSASLGLLNEVGEILSHTLEVEQQLSPVLRRLLSGLSLQTVWLRLEPHPAGGDPLTLAEAAEPHSPPPVGLAQALHHRLVSEGTRVVSEGEAAAVPLLGETGLLGSLGATAMAGDTLTDEQVELLTTVAQQVRVAVENARLYRERQESLRSYVSQVTQAQEEERLRIARELHDDTAQELVRLVRKLEQLRRPSPPDMTQPIDDLLNLTRDILQAVRRYSRDLRPSVLDDLGLLAAIEMLIDDCRLPKGARLQVTGKPRRLDRLVELALFRIAQEALRNVENHAEATSASVELDFGDQGLRLSVTDDGLGFSAPENISALSLAGKLGLVGMKERAELVGGHFELRSSPGGGTEVAVTVATGATAPADAATP